MSKNTMNRKNRELMLKSDHEAGAQVLAEAKRVLERATEEVERYQAQYECATGHVARESVEASVLSSAANFLTNYVLGNIRFDLMVTYAARIEAHRAVLAQEVE